MLLVIPVAVILWRTFQPGFGQFYAWVSTPAAISALNLSLLVVAIVVPLNVVFGIPTALVLARNRFRGKGVLQAIIDLPFAVSPVIVGVALIVLWGSAGALGFVEKDLGFKIIFGLPGIVLASIFVTLPFVVREVEPVLHELGTDQEEAAATLGSGWWQTFWRITLPSIRWGLTYGIVLTIARMKTIAFQWLVARFPIETDMNALDDQRRNCTIAQGSVRGQSSTFTLVACGRPNAPAVATVSPSFMPSA